MTPHDRIAAVLTAYMPAGIARDRAAQLAMIAQDWDDETAMDWDDIDAPPQLVWETIARAALPHCGGAMLTDAQLVDATVATLAVL